MSMKQLIKNALENYKNTNSNRRQQDNGIAGAQLVGAADAMLAKLENEDTFSIDDLKKLIKMPGAASDSAAVLTKLSDTLNMYCEYLETRRRYEQEHPARRIPFHSATEFKGEEIELLPYVFNWNYELPENDAVSDADLETQRAENFRNKRQKELEDSKKSFVRENIELLTAANNVWFGSRAYNNFLREMRRLDQMLTAGNAADAQAQYNEVLRLGQAYLAYKASDRRSINPKGRQRIKLVNDIVCQLTVFQAEIDGNEKMLPYRAEFEQQRLAAENERRQQEEAAQAQLRRQQEEKNNELYQKAADDLAFLRNTKNMFDSSYYEKYTNVCKYCEDSAKEQGKYLKKLELSENERKRISVLAERSDSLATLRKRYASDNALPFSSDVLYRTVEDLYQVHFRPDYLSNPERDAYGRYDGATFSVNGSTHRMLAQRKAFEKFLTEMQNDSKKYEDFVLHPENQEQVFKSLMSDCILQLKAKLAADSNETKETVKYLLDYKNFLDMDYWKKVTFLQEHVTAMRILPEYEGKLPRTMADVLAELGMTEKQYEKVTVLANEYTYARNAYGPNNKDTGKAKQERVVFQKTMRILGDIYCNPAFGEPGNELPLPKKLKSYDSNPGYDVIYENLEDVGKLYDCRHDAAALAEGMKKLKPEIEAQLTKEAIDAEHDAVKESVEYLKDYRHMIYPEYAARAKKVESYLAKVELYNEIHNVEADPLAEFGLTEGQYSKIKKLAFKDNTYVKYYMENGYASADGLINGLRMLTDIYCNPAMAIPGNEDPMPSKLDNENLYDFNTDYDALYVGLPEYEALKAKMDPSTKAGCEALHELLTGDPEVLKKTIKDLYLASAKAGRVAQYNDSQNKPQNKINLRDSVAGQVHHEAGPRAKA